MMSEKLLWAQDLSDDELPPPYELATVREFLHDTTDARGTEHDSYAPMKQA